MNDVTMTRKAFVTAGAVATATLAAGVGLAGATTARAEEAAEAQSYDVVVLGAGGAGLAAAATAGEAGAKVVVLEAGAFAGGATIYSGAHMLYLGEEFEAAQERNDDDVRAYLDMTAEDVPAAVADDLAVLQGQVQAYLDDPERQGRFDSVERVMVDHWRAGSGVDAEGNAVALDYAMVRAAAEASGEVFDWLVSGGMEIKEAAYNAHAHSPVNSGTSLIDALSALAEAAGVEVRYETRATGLVVEGGVVVGVRAEGADGVTQEIRAGRVVIATGGFSANGALAALYQNVGAGLSANGGTTNPKTNRGEGMAMAQRAGAAVRDLQFLATVLEGYHGGSTLGEAGKITPTAQLVVNAAGVRFADESKGSALQKAMNDQPDGLGFFVGDAAMLDALNAAQEGLGDDLSTRDWFCVADTLEEAAQAAGLDPEALASAVDAFNAQVASGGEDPFGRTEFNGGVTDAPFVVAKMEMHYHLTFGGLIINEKAQVIGIDGAPIGGLYAAGDVVSGYEGVKHQSGDCLSVVVNTGRIAGTLA